MMNWSMHDFHCASIISSAYFNILINCVRYRASVSLKRFRWLGGGGLDFAGTPVCRSGPSSDEDTDAKTRPDCEVNSSRLADTLHLKNGQIVPKMTNNSNNKIIAIINKIELYRLSRDTEYERDQKQLQVTWTYRKMRTCGRVRDVSHSEGSANTKQGEGDARTDHKVNIWLHTRTSETGSFAWHYESRCLLECPSCAVQRYSNQQWGNLNQ